MKDDLSSNRHNPAVSVEQYSLEGKRQESISELTHQGNPQIVQSFHKSEAPSPPCPPTAYPCLIFDVPQLPPVAFGNFYENAAAFGIAKYLSEIKRERDALLLAIAIRDHIHRTREGKSERWLLPEILDFIQYLRAGVWK